MRNPIFWHYLAIFLVATLLILLLSIWCAFYLAKGISKPIQELLVAISKIREGKWDTQVALNPTSDLNILVAGFNEMTKALQLSRDHLVHNNREILLILEHIKASVFFINPFGKIIMCNAAAKELTLSFLKKSRFKNKKVSFFGPKITQLFFSLIRKFKKSGKQQFTKEITFSHDSITKTFMVHFTFIETTIKRESKGLLVVIEDMTDIFKINKIKTWQEAARQLAHEIKNPLTPIQLATQRLRRKHRKMAGMAGEDPVFLESTDTILNQVHLIRNLVAHFSEFARMPEGKKEQTNMNSIVREVACLYQVSYPNITFLYDLEEFLPSLYVDKKKIKRVLINLFDNSIRALTNEKHKHEIGNEKHLSIKTRFKTGRNQIELLLSDNGPGIPRAVRDKLFLPYISIEKKNTGLGLAIVHDIITQMGGTIKLISPSTGAAFRILLPSQKS